MSSKGDSFLKKNLGEDFFESLAKFELWKPGTRTVIDHEEIKTALQIVPRVVMALLIKELTPMSIGDNKEFDINVNQSNPGDAKLKVNKHERDVYSGTVEQDNKVLVDFKYRSLPGIGLIIMSALELYDINELTKESNAEPQAIDKVQALIEERITLHDIINKVVDKKIDQRSALQQMFLMKLTEELHKEKSEHERTRVQLAGAGVAALGYAGDEIKPGDYGHSASFEDAKELYKEKEKLRKENEKLKKGSPLKKFIEDRKNKLKKNEFEIKMLKGECVNCEDCGKNIFDGIAFSGCICLGDDMDRKVFIKKTEEGIKVRFGRGWDKENIEMLVETLRKRNDK